jgi:hypothetical protein
MNWRACSSVILRLGRPPSIRACLAARPPPSGRLAEHVNALISSLVASLDLSSAIGFTASRMISYTLYSSTHPLAGVARIVNASATSGRAVNPRVRDARRGRLRLHLAIRAGNDPDRVHARADLDRGHADDRVPLFAVLIPAVELYRAKLRALQVADAVDDGQQVLRRLVEGLPLRRVVDDRCGQVVAHVGLSHFPTVVHCLPNTGTSAPRDLPSSDWCNHPSIPRMPTQEKPTSSTGL